VRKPKRKAQEEPKPKLKDDRIDISTSVDVDEIYTIAQLRAFVSEVECALSEVQRRAEDVNLFVHGGYSGRIYAIIRGKLREC